MKTPKLTFILTTITLGLALTINSLVISQVSGKPAAVQTSQESKFNVFTGTVVEVVDTTLTVKDSKGSLKRINTAPATFWKAVEYQPELKQKLILVTRSAENGDENAYYLVSKKQLIKVRYDLGVGLWELGKNTKPPLGRRQALGKQQVEQGKAVGEANQQMSKIPKNADYTLLEGKLEGRDGSKFIIKSGRKTYRMSERLNDFWKKMEYQPTVGE